MYEIFCGNICMVDNICKTWA